MNEKNAFGKLGEVFELAIAKKMVVQEELVFYLLEKGRLNMFFKDKSPDGHSSRLRFVNDYEAPALIAIPAFDARRDLVFHAAEHCLLQRLTLEQVKKAHGKLKEEFAEYIDVFVNKGVAGFTEIRPTHIPVSFQLNAENKTKFEGDLYPSKPGEVLWIVPDKPRIKLLGSFGVPDCYAFPMTQGLWYHIEEGVSFKVLTTQKLMDTYDGFYENLLKFRSVIFELDDLLMRKGIGEDIRQIYVNIESDKGHWKYSHDKLFEIIDPVDQKDTITFAESDALMGCLGLIGKYEKITFKRPAFENKKVSPLDNIARASKVRYRKVKLHEKWYTSNNGALLAFKKESNLPVAMIPKGQSAYWAVDYTNKHTELVTEKNAAEFKEEAFTFFTPFPAEKIDGKSLLKFGLQFVRRELGFAILIGSISAIIALFIPIVTGYIFDQVIPNNSMSELAQIFILLITIALSMGIMDFAQSISVLRLEGKLNYKLQSAIWDRMLTLKVRFFHKYSAGDLTERSMGVEKIRGVLSGSVLSALIAFIFSFFYLILLFYYSVKLALVALALGLIIVAFTVVASYFGFKHVMVIRHLEAVLTGFLFQVISGISKIRVTNSEERAFSQWVGRYSFQKKHYASKRKINVAGEVFGSFFPIFSAIFIFLMVHHLMWSDNSDFTVGNFISFNNAFISFQGALLQMSMATVPILTIHPIYSMFKPIIEAESENFGEKDDPGELRGEIVVSNLRFRYNDAQPMIIDNLNLRIHEGEYIALVGGSGSGKSTLLRLLLGFEEPLGGQVFYDNKDLAKLDLQSVRSQLGVVLQNGSLMHGNILYNIIGNSNLTEEDAWEAARLAGCDKEIEALPDKMYTKVSISESTLSGGQIQRIVIARAFARKPKILFFDEATSALDNVTQSIITKSIGEMKATRIVIAHRLSTIMNANRIVVLDKGKLVEEGSYEELLSKGGYFSELAKRQFL